VSESVDLAAIEARARGLKLPGQTGSPLMGDIPLSELPPDIAARARKGNKVMSASARAAFVAGDPETLLCSFSNEEGLGIVSDNSKALRDRGIYERALVRAYTATRTNWSMWSIEDLGCLLAKADKEKLRAAGDPIPEGESFTLYRGVAGSGEHRKEAGLSWTRSADQAAWFAERGADGELEDPAVYVTEAPRDAIAFYSGEREEDDFILITESYKRTDWEIGR